RLSTFNLLPIYLGALDVLFSPPVLPFFMDVLFSPRPLFSALMDVLFSFQFCRPVWNRWLDMAVLNGSLDIPDYSVKQRAYRRVKWIAHGWPYMHPVQDMQAQKMAVRSGFKSRSEVVSEQGYDSEQIDAEISADNRRSDGLDLKYDSDARDLERQETTNGSQSNEKSGI
nr:hypothetical protein [Endozoicomonas sp.]